MRKSLAIMFVCCTLLLTIGLTASYDSVAAGSEAGGAGAEKGLRANRYVETEEILFGDHYESLDATLTLYEDGNGTLDFPLAFDELEDVIVDPDAMLLYTASDAAAYEFALEGNQLLLYFDPDVVVVFEVVEEGFPLHEITVDAQAMIQAKSDEAYAAGALSIAEDGWYHIATPEDFRHIADDLGGKYVLDNDIDDWWGGESTVFSPIGTPEEPFTGELNGNGHTLTGTLAYTGQQEAWGLFGCNAGWIHDLTIGYVDCEELHERYMQYWEEEFAYNSLDDAGLPTDATRYYSVLCGLNRGTIQNIRFEDRTYVPDICCFPNVYDTIFVGIVCGFNDGTISGVELLETDLTFYTLDKHTAVDIGLVCGYQTAKGVLENAHLNLNNGIYLRGWGFLQNIAPLVNAGLFVGEAEGGTTLRDSNAAEGGDVMGAGMLAGADLRFGGLVGCVRGDIALSGIEAKDLDVYMDAQGADYMDEQNFDYAPTPGVSHIGGGLIGWADGSVTLSNIILHDIAVDVVLRPGGDPGNSMAGGMVGFCGGNLTARSLVMDGRSSVDASVEQGAAFAGGVCGFCKGGADVAECSIAVSMNPLFHGWLLYEANVLGYVCGDAVFSSLRVTCQLDESTGQSMGHSIMADSASSYCLASLAGYAESGVTVEGCDVDVVYDMFGTPGAVYYDDSLQGLYNAG